MKATLSNEILDSLAQKLDEFSQVLSDEEQAVLLAIFQMGASTLKNASEGTDTESGSFGTQRVAAPTIAPRPSSGLQSNALSRSLKSAFTPALARGLSNINVAASGVEVGVKWSA